MYPSRPLFGDLYWKRTIPDRRFPLNRSLSSRKQDARDSSRFRSGPDPSFSRGLRNRASLVPAAHDRSRLGLLSLETFSQGLTEGLDAQGRVTRLKEPVGWILLKASTFHLRSLRSIVVAPEQVPGLVRRVPVEYPEDPEVQLQPHGRLVLPPTSTHRVDGKGGVLHGETFEE